MSQQRPDADLLDRPAGESVRIVALAELARAARARRALGSGDDPEALHDFRVALRRLRSLLRAFRSELDGSIPKRLGRELKGVAAATGAGRDAEVGLDWLARFGPPSSSRAAAGRELVRERLESVHVLALRRARSELVGRFDRLEHRLVQRLSAWTIELTPAEPPERFRALVCAELDRHRTALGSTLSAVAAGTALGPDEEIHSARIAAKRVRYLLDPLAGALDATRPALDRLRALQDLLGEWNDLSVLAATVAELAAGLESGTLLNVARAGAPAKRRRPPGRSGLVELAERIAAARSERWHRLSAGWVGETAPQRAMLDAELATLERELAP